MKRDNNTNLLYFHCCLIISVLFCPQISAQSIFHIEGSTGIEFSSLEWAVAGNINGNSPNIFSELQWTKLSSINYNIQATIKKNNISYFLRSSLSPNLSGNVEDTDYSGDNRTAPQYKEIFNSTGGRRLISETGIKLDIKVNSLNILQVRTGIRYRDQRLFIDQENNKIQSYYNSRWIGIFLGICKIINLNESITMSFYADADLSDYYGYGNWKLRTELLHPKSFIHNTTAYGLNTNFKTIFQFNKSMSLNTTLEGCYNNSFKGTDILYFKDGHSVSTQFNGVNSLVFVPSIGLCIAF